MRREPTPALTCNFTGGGDGDRTHYLLHAMQALYQLSYAPVAGKTIAATWDCPARRERAKRAIRRAIRRRQSAPRHYHAWHGRRVRHPGHGAEVAAPLGVRGHLRDRQRRSPAALLRAVDVSLPERPGPH